MLTLSYSLPKVKVPYSDYFADKALYEQSKSL